MLYSLNVAINENRNIWILPADTLSEDIPCGLCQPHQLNVLHSWSSCSGFFTLISRYWICCKVWSLPSKPLMFARCLEIIWWKAPIEPPVHYFSVRETHLLNRKNKRMSCGPPISIQHKLICWAAVFCWDRLHIFIVRIKMSTGLVSFTLPISACYTPSLI